MPHTDISPKVPCDDAMNAIRADTRKMMAPYQRQAERERATDHQQHASEHAHRAGAACGLIVQQAASSRHGAGLQQHQ